MRRCAFRDSVRKKAIAVMLPIALIAAQVAAYDHPLGSHAIREAYLIGSDNKFAEILTFYTKNLPAPKTGPHVAQVEVRTPFAQVIVMSHEHSVGYSAQSAAQDYKKNPDTVQVRIQIRATATYALASPAAAPQSPCQGVQRMNSVQECFLDFRFAFSQGKDLTPKSSYGVPIYSGGDSGGILVAADLWFTFSTADIASAPFQVTVSTPDGQEFSAGFDLATLR
jgi:hypothetical protein